MNHGQQNGQAKEASMVALALIVGALLACSMVVLSNTQALGMEANTRPALLLGNESLPPMSFMKHGKPAGIVIDLAEAISKHMLRPVEIRLMNWTEAQRLVLDGRADALLQMDANPERLKIFDFSETLLTSEFTIFTSFERSCVSSIRDLAGLKVGVEEKGRPILLLKEYPQINLEIIPDFIKGFRMLENGSVDAVVADRWIGRYVLAEYNIQDVNLFDIPILQSQSAIAVKKGNSILLGDINAALSDIRRDGSYDRIIQSWRSKEVVFKTREQLRQQVWLIVAISAALIATLAGIAVLAREVRRRKRVEASLLESKEQLRLFIDNVPASMAMFDRQMRYLNVSSRWLSDYNLGDRSLTGLSHYEVFPEIPESWKTVHRRALAGETLKSDSDRFERADGSVQWLRWEVRPWFDHSDNIAGIVIFTEDITERKRAEEKLIASQSRYRDLAESIPAMLWATDAQGVTIDHNRSWYEYTGQTLEQSSGDGWKDIVHPDDLQHAVDLWGQSTRTGDNYSIEYRIRRASDGVYRWHSVRAALRKDQQGKPMGWFGTCIDIDDRKRAEEALRLSEEKYALAFSNNPASIALSRLEDGLFLDVNDTWVATSGYSRDDVIGQSARKLHIWPTTEAAAKFVNELREKGTLRGWEYSGPHNPDNSLR